MDQGGGTGKEVEPLHPTRTLPAAWVDLCSTTLDMSNPTDSSNSDCMHLAYYFFRIILNHLRPFAFCSSKPVRIETLIIVIASQKLLSSMRPHLPTEEQK